MKNHIFKIFFTISALVLFCACSEETITITGQGTLTGKVVEKSTNIPLENVKISTNPNTSTIFSDSEGNFQISNIDVGDYSVKAEKEGYIVKFEGATIQESVSANVIFELEIETANNDAPNAPLLLEPLNNSIEVGLSVDLVWSGSDPEEDELTYSVEILNDQNADVISFTEITDTTLTVSGLMYNTKYFWQVTANDGINNSVSSNVFNFRTIEFPENRIFFTRKINGNNVIFSTDDDGNDIQLTSQNNNSWRPRKAQSLNKIAFLRSNGGQTHVFTMNLDGSDVQQITSAVPVNGFNFEEIDFEWTNNDSQILYPSFDKLYVIDSDGSGLNQIYQTSNGNFITEVDWNQNTSTIALKTNNSNGYEVEIFTINTFGVVQDIILQGITGAAGGIDLSFDGTKLLYTRDVTGNENQEYRQLNSQVFIYDLTTMTTNSTVSFEKPPGTNDLDAKFSPTEAEIIIENTPNDGLSQSNIYKLTLGQVNGRELIEEDAKMPDWK
ncbi:carboxypeptidase regulatory-like domain-containing protein [Mesoflavibacter sp. SCSIO 43206]|uniref:carboxypeptidase regulatory-like domain-containing protein n=1 Tax=Mesoflavibacter sp. SCSIO 43206 TaxID=2779362 RepID=UPI001CA95641|nr:carboxypeptidase regulatory-like domain-containing protein [Mesoflavibacter sp. SCSIO 43206]UAB74545.1 carboxypeptidase regulatory-like domain-containing protein [Mesoflavibacter sp. SCSIO 43206]